MTEAEIKIRCLEIAASLPQPADDPLEMAKEMYDWIVEGLNDV
jgi:hypothetical protein